MKRLIVLRHAKSDWDAPFSSDHERPLASRGKAAARTMGRLLTRIGQAPDHVTSSSAVRAAETARLAAAAGGWEVPIDTTAALYLTGPGRVLEEIAATPDAVTRLMVVGHQPDWGGLVYRLTGAAVQMKTATAAIIDLMLGSSWDHGGDVAGELVALLQPRHFTGDDWENWLGR